MTDKSTSSINPTPQLPDLRDFTINMLAVSLLRHAGKPRLIFCWKTEELSSPASIQVKQEAERQEARYVTITIDDQQGVSVDFHWDIPEN